MDNYKDYNSEKEKEKLYLEYTDQLLDVLTLESQHLQSFLNELPKYIDFMNNYQSLDDQSVSISIEAFNNFARYNPKEKIAEVLIESNAIDYLVKYCSNDIANNTSAIFQENILKSFNIFGELSKSKDHIIILKMIQKGILSLCVNNYSVLDEILNKNLNFIMHNFISSSFFSRALVYSTGIFTDFIENVESSQNDVPLLMSQFISGITRRFIIYGPSYCSPDPKEPENMRCSPENGLEFWDDFMENYYADTIFNKELFEDFITDGINFSKGTPFFEIVDFMIASDNELCMLNGLETLKILVYRDNSAERYHPLCEDINENRISFLNCFSTFIDTENSEIIEAALQILINSIFPKSININEVNLNDVSKVIIDFLLRIEFDFSEKIIAYSAKALNNIVLKVKKFDYIEDEDDCEKLLLFIYRCLRNGSFKIRKAMLFFYLTVVKIYFDNEKVYHSVLENMNEIISIAEFTPNINLNFHILSCLKAIFEYEDIHFDRNDLLRQFISTNGFDMTISFEEDECNPELARKARKFNEKFSGFDEGLDGLEVSMDNLEDYECNEYDDNNFPEDNSDPADIFYKRKSSL